MTRSHDLQGVIVPLTTPFGQDGEIDRPGFARQIDWMLEAGVDGVVVGGSTGEGFTLDDDELMALSRLALDITAGRIPVMASILADSTRAAIRRAKTLSELPLAGLQIAPPHYIFTPSDDGLVAFYRDIGATTALPIVIYNVISWTNVRPAVVARIMDATNAVVAVKQSDKDLGTFAELVRTVGGRRVFGAIDGSLMSCYDLDIAGSIAAIASAVPHANVALWRASRSDDRVAAKAINAALCDLWQGLASPNLPARVKAAQAAQGVPAGLPRAPMEAPTAEERARIAALVTVLSKVATPQPRIHAIGA